MPPTYPPIGVEKLFTYHPPHGDQADRYYAIREQAKQFAYCLLAHTPPGADQAAAIRKLRECVMTANAAIALEDEEGEDN